MCAYMYVYAVGGQLVGTMVYVDHHAPVGHKGYYGGITLAGGALGVLLGSLEGALIVAVCTPQQVPHWHSTRRSHAHHLSPYIMSGSP